MISPISEAFPLDSAPRPEQERSWGFVRSNHEKGKRISVLQLPPGVGKSALAVGLANAWPHVDGTSQGAYVLTVQRILQSQYIDSFPGVVASVWSKREHRCSAVPGASCSSGAAVAKAFPELASSRSCASSCPYSADLRRFLASPVAVTNVHYFLSQTTYSKGLLAPRSVMVFDECHSLEQCVVGFASVEITRERCKDVGLEMPEFKSQDDAYSWVLAKYSPALKREVESASNEMKKSAAKGDEVGSTAAAERWSLLDGIECRLNRLLGDCGRRFDAIGWVCDVGLNETTFRPIDVGPWAQERLFSMAPEAVLMSATIIDLGSFCRSIGLRESEVSYHEEDCPFPASERPIVYDPVGSMSRRNIEETLPKVLRKCVTEVQTNPHDKGIIHCRSYRVCEAVTKVLEDSGLGKRVVTHGRNDRDRAYAKHIEDPGPTVLVSPSMEEGIDLAGDLSRFQLVCKIPYANLGDSRVRRRMEIDRSSYDVATIRSLIQLTGRSNRYLGDYSKTTIFDSDLEMLVKNAGRFFPRWWLQALV